MNRLSQEKSPYLQQHASNPVDWYPWGEEAFKAARDQNKPIFLSIGYSTCHWCHVMAHESFENKDIASVMNRRYINIKVDREERPDIDAVYMSAVQALTGSGGWPMSVWLDHDLRPYYGGTYFPPEDRWGRPGFPSVMEQLADVFSNERARVSEASEHMAAFLKQKSTSRNALPESANVEQAALRSLTSAFDGVWGGFSPAPKFPMPVYLEFLLDVHSRHDDQRALEMALHTFRKMAEGGLYDQLGGGFSRYSTDEKWLVPHFEKMLYDNAQLLRSGAGIWAATQDETVLRAVTGTAGYLLRDLRHEGGAFFSAEDADSEGKEGAFYTWLTSDFHRVLGDEAPAAAKYFGLTVEGNFHDPHVNEVGRNVLSIAGTPPSPPDTVRDRLFRERERRPRPHRDEKILTEWNGLAISGLARAGFSLGRDEWIRAAERAADFIQKNLFDESLGMLYRRWRDGDVAIEGQLADHAMFVEGLIDLFEVTGDVSRLDLALRLHRIQNEAFVDPDGGYFMGRASPSLFVRPKDDGDNVIPSGSATAVANGFRLFALTADESIASVARSVLRSFADGLSQRPHSLTRMASALAWSEGRFQEIVITGGKASGELLQAVRQQRPRDSVMVLMDPGNAPALCRTIPALQPIGVLADRPAVYICRQFACRAPITDPALLLSSLRS